MLAAGAGTRAGGPKALRRDADGVPWLHLAVAALRGGGCDPVLVVLSLEELEPAPPLGSVELLLQPVTAVIVVKMTHRFSNLFIILLAPRAARASADMGVLVACAREPAKWLTHFGAQSFCSREGP